MIFKDREEAGEKLSELLKKDRSFIRNKKNAVVVSLLRGGVVVGNIIAKKLKVKHLPLVVTKIPAPYNPELGIGALCFDVTYLENQTISPLSLNHFSIQSQIKIAKNKFDLYCKKFFINKKVYSRQIKNKIIILVDDGIATGSSIKTALLFLKTKKPKKIFLAVPVAPTDFNIKGFDKVFILHRDPYFSSVSQFYQSFPQVEDEGIKKIIKYRR